MCVWGTLDERAVQKAGTGRAERLFVIPNEPAYTHMPNAFSGVPFAPLSEIRSSVQSGGGPEASDDDPSEQGGSPLITGLENKNRVRFRADDHPQTEGPLSLVLPESKNPLACDPGGRYKTLSDGLEAIRQTRTRPEGAPYVPYADCSAAELDALLEWRPILDKHEGFRMMAQYLLHSSYRADNGGHLANWETIFRQFGLRLARGGDYPNARTLLWAYKLIVDKDLTWTDSHSDGRARTITKQGIPSFIRSLRDQYLTYTGDFDSVFFVNGNEVNRASRKRLREDQEEDFGDPVIDPPQDTWRWRQYLDDRSSRLFSSISENANALTRRLRRGDVDFPFAKKSFDEQRRIYQALRKLDQWPKPRYEVANWSPRLRSPGESQLVGLDSALRKELYANNHVELDLSKAHAAIAAGDWGNVQYLEDWLEKHLTDGNNFDFWEALAWTVINTGPTPPGSNLEAMQAAVKKGFYTLVYGGKENEIYFEMAKIYWDALGIDGSPFDGFKAFLEHPMMNQLLEARTEKLNEIQENSGMVDCYGRFITTEAFEDKPNKDNPARGVLAYCAQARELFLLQPILELAEREDSAVERGRKQRPDFQILLYQYDGFTIQVTRKEQVGRITERLQEAVRNHAQKHGYRTALEVEWIAS